MSTVETIREETIDAAMVEQVCAIASAREASVVPANKVRVAVAMSGGVDSSTTALLLQREGYDLSLIHISK